MCQLSSVDQIISFEVLLKVDPGQFLSAPESAYTTFTRISLVHLTIFLFDFGNSALFFDFRKGFRQQLHRS